MIARVTTPADRDRFARALQGALCLEPQLGAALDLFWKNPGGGWQFYTSGEGGALALQGPLATALGPFDGEELDSFLTFLGAETLLTPGPPPPGWEEGETLTAFRGTPRDPGPCPEGFRLVEDPSLGELSRLVMGENTREEQENFYVQACIRKNHGKGTFRALADSDGALAAGLGATTHSGWAYLAQGYVLPRYRGHGLGSWLIATLARELAARGEIPCLLCRPERKNLYRRMGMKGKMEYYLYKKKE